MNLPQPVPYYELSVPNRVRDLTDQWQCLYENDPTVPALKTYLLHEGERLWQEIIVVCIIRRILWNRK